MQSKLIKLNKVEFPEFLPELIYMLPFKKGDKLPVKYKRWQKTVDSMLQKVNSDKEIYLTLQQSTVNQGEHPRRPGAHIDGIWIPSIKAHRTGVHKTMAWDTGGGNWKSKNLVNGGIIIACDSVPPIVYLGPINGTPGEGGDCTHINLSNTEKKLLTVNHAYIGNVNMVHETTEAAQVTNRTFVRITMDAEFELAA